MSDTPETDQQTFSFSCAQVNLPPSGYKLVRAEFAQQLERERNDARKIALKFRRAINTIHMQTDRLGVETLPWEKMAKEGSNDAGQ
jgi:hypothetical protein